jgi:hypothetical protein
MSLGSLSGRVEIESPTIPINYFQNPVLGRSSVGQLLQRPGLLGFSNLVWVSGDWRGLASPFCRIGREFPERLVCEPEYIRQESQNATIEAAFVGADEIAIEIGARCALTLSSGAPGKIHHNGGTANQQWMAFDPFRNGATLQQVSSDTILASNGDYCAAFTAPGISMAPDGNGWNLELLAGRTILGVGIAFRSPEKAQERASSAFKKLVDTPMEKIRAHLRSEWDKVFRSFPLATDIPRDVAFNAVWCVYSNLAAPEGCLHRPAVIAAKIQYPGIFPWDSAFAAVALKDADPALAKDQIELYTDQLRNSPDGSVGEMTVQDSGGGVQFPLLSWAAWKIHCTQPDLDFFKRIYPQLARHAQWWTKQSAKVEGIPCYQRVFSFDDSPRFDMFSDEGRMTLREPLWGADLIAICAWDQIHLAAIAREIGLHDAAAAHEAAALTMVQFMEEHLYDEQLGRYVDVGTQSGRRGTVDTPMAHFPAMLSPDKARQTRAAHALSSEGQFWGRFGLATVSPEETAFDPCRIWRGPIWLSVNFLCAQACAAMDFPAHAEAIAISSRDLIESNLPLPRGIMEYFNYMTGEGSGAHHIATMSAAPLLSFLQGHHRESVLALPAKSISAAA